MVIQEILDSTRSWELLRGNDIDDTFEKIQNTVKNFSLSLETAIVLQQIVSDRDQWVSIKEILREELDNAITGIEDMLNIISRYPDDEDLNNKIEKCRIINSRLIQMFAELP